MALKFSNLTRPAIRSMKAGEKITEHGITAERQKDGDVRYSVNIMVDGQRIHRVIGRESERPTLISIEQVAKVFRRRVGRLDKVTALINPCVLP